MLWSMWLLILWPSELILEKGVLKWGELNYTVGVLKIDGHL